MGCEVVLDQARLSSPEGGCIGSAADVSVLQGSSPLTFTTRRGRSQGARGSFRNSSDSDATSLALLYINNSVPRDRPRRNLCAVFNQNPDV